MDTEKLTEVTETVEKVVEKAAQEAVTPEVSKKISLYQKYMETLPEKALGLGIRVVFALLVFIIGAEIIKLIRHILKKSLKRANADLGLIQFLDSLIKVFLYIILIFSIASSFGLDATSVVAVLGSAGVAVGLALQGSLSNFAGGVLILLIKPFKVGDYIKEDNKGNEGTVTEISLFYTKLMTLDERIVVLPNGALANNSLTNYTATAYRRLDVNVDISYQADIKKAKDVALKVLREDSAAISDKDMLVFVDDLCDSSVRLTARCYVTNENYWPARGRLLENIKLAYDQNGIEIPYTQVDVYMKNNGSI